MAATHATRLDLRLSLTKAMRAQTETTDDLRRPYRYVIDVRRIKRRIAISHRLEILSQS